MGSLNLLRANDLMIEEATRKEAADVAKDVHDRQVVGLELILDDGKRLQVPRAVAEMMMRAIQGLAEGRVTMVTTPNEFTSSAAAEVIGVSRPTLMKLVKEGRIESRSVGSHHRFKADDVFALMEERRKQRGEAFDRLRETDEDLERWSGNA